MPDDKTHDYAAMNMRLEALNLAVKYRTGLLTADQVISDADKYATFILGK